MADLLAFVCDVYCDFVTFPFCILRQVWYLIVSIPESCCLSYFQCGRHEDLSTRKSDIHRGLAAEVNSFFYW